MSAALEGVCMELQDCALPNLRGKLNNIFLFDHEKSKLIYVYKKTVLRNWTRMRNLLTLITLIFLSCTLGQ